MVADISNSKNKLTPVASINPTTVFCILTKNTHKEHKARKLSVYIRCTEIKGFHIRISPISDKTSTGKKGYWLTGRLGGASGSPKHIQLGECSTSDFETVRAKAIEAKALLKKGIDIRDRDKEEAEKEIQKANKGIPFVQAWHEFMEFKKTIWAKETYDDYERKIRLQLEPLADMPIGEITTQHVNDWWRKCPKTATDKNAFKYAQLVFDDLVSDKKVDENPFIESKKNKKVSSSFPKKHKVITHIPHDHLDLYLEGWRRAFKYHSRSVMDAILFMVLTGKRTSECCHAKFKDLDLYNGTLTLRHKLDIVEDLVCSPLVWVLLKHRQKLLEEWIADSNSNKKRKKLTLSNEKQEYIFWSHDSNSLHVTDTDKAMKKIHKYYLESLEDENKRLGIKRKAFSLRKYRKGTEEKKFITNHDLRRTYSTIGNVCGYSDSQLADLLVHEGDSQTADYIQVSREHSRNKRKTIENEINRNQMLSNIIVDFYEGNEDMLSPESIQEKDNRGFDRKMRAYFKNYSHKEHLEDWKIENDKPFEPSTDPDDLSWTE